MHAIRHGLSWKYFGKDWGRRVAQCEALRLKMNLAAAKMAIPV
jgi:hypothetical protein